ncbi:MAG: hypothetical protein Q8Q74_16010, partial [Polaromonas sp.]|nr:hypothetical protein [Polaromonas sp.]
MLEVLKQLQIKPPAPRVQVEICNQKSARDCHFLLSYIFALLSYMAMRHWPHLPPKQSCSNAPALSLKTLQALELKALTGKTYSLFLKKPLQLHDLERNPK